MRISYHNLPEVMTVIGITISDIGEHTFHVLKKENGSHIILLGRDDINIVEPCLSDNYLWVDDGSFSGFYHKIFWGMKDMHDQLYDGDPRAISKLIEKVETP